MSNPESNENLHPTENEEAKWEQVVSPYREKDYWEILIDGIEEFFPLHVKARYIQLVRALHEEYVQSAYRDMQEIARLRNLIEK